MTAGKDHDNDDEDGGDIQISSFFFLGEQDCLLLDCLIDYEVEDQ